MIRLGLIGGNIGASRARHLHRLAGEICGLAVRYDNLVPAELGKDFDTVFDDCAAGGYAGINITYPYKETVMTRVAPADEAVRAIGAANTVVFGGRDPVGYNTDATGFVAAFRANFPGSNPGTVALVGAGGAGRAIGFALLTLGASEIRVFDTDRRKADGLVAALDKAGTRAAVRVSATVAEAVAGADGLINCTPIGMTGMAGSAIPADLIAGNGWAFDVVYTPVATEFLEAARRNGRAIMSGYELFFFQGVDAFRLFTGHEVPQDRLRRALLDNAPG